MAPPKRSLSDDGGATSTEEETALAVVNESRLTKRARVTDVVPVSKDVVTVQRLDARTSALAAPTMQLSGHSATVYSLKFDPSGQHAASASFDKSIFLWDVYGECRNYNVLNGHKNAVLEVHWTYDSSQLVSASADKTVGVWDAQTGTRIKKFMGHTGIVNSCCPVTKGPTLVVSGSDDGTTKLWDVRSKRAVKTFENGYQVTATCFSGDNSQVISGGIDGDIKLWDLRKDAVSLVLQGHTDIITSLSLSPDGNYLLSNAMDATVRRWDVRPFVVNSTRQLTVYQGAKHGFEKILIRSGWSADMRLVASGSSDRHVYIWDTETGALRYHLPGHTGSVNEVTFHPNEPIVGSCGSDKQIYLGELVTATCFSGDNSQVISGGIDGDIKLWDLRKDAVSLVLQGHTDIITSLSLSPDGNYLLSNAMDATVRRWDVRPFVVNSTRQLTVYQGAKHGFEKILIRSGWSADMRLVASGSSDRHVYIWDTETGALRYHLPGHTGSVNEVTFHPNEPIVGSCGSDKQIYLGELVGLI